MKSQLGPSKYQTTPGYYCESMDLAERKVSRKKALPNPYQAIRDKIIEEKIAESQLMIVDLQRDGSGTRS